MIVENISKLAKIDQRRLRSIANMADFKYKVYPIEKRGGGERIICHPSRDLKSVQRLISTMVLSRLPVHGSATAYCKGASIRKNAMPHSDTRFTCRVDFREFFPSFRRDLIELFLANREVLNQSNDREDDINFILDIVCRFDRLTIGAPSSPILTNAMMYDFDLRMTEWCQERALVYTRYADDIFVSAKRKNSLGEIQDVVTGLIAEIPHLDLEINVKKFNNFSKKHRRTITGLVLTTDGRISVGRSRKRAIKSLIHRWKLGQLNEEETLKLRGNIAFSIDADPDFQDTLSQKYGDDTIDALLKGRANKKRPG